MAMVPLSRAATQSDAPSMRQEISDRKKNLGRGSVAPI